MKTGKELAEDGMAAATAHAEAENPGWAEKARAALASYVQGLEEGDTFTSVDLRAYAAETGLPAPPDNRAWGSIVRMAANDGIISSLGYVPSPDRKQHGAPQTLWEKPFKGD